MDGLIIPILGWALVAGYSYLVVHCMMVGCDEWWHPFVYAIALPFYWIYENRVGIAIGGAAIAALFGLIGILVKVS